MPKDESIHTTPPCRMLDDDERLFAFALPYELSFIKAAADGRVESYWNRPPCYDALPEREAEMIGKVWALNFIGLLQHFDHTNHGHLIASVFAALMAHPQGPVEDAFLIEFACQVQGFGPGNIGFYHCAIPDPHCQPRSKATADA